MTHKPLLPWQMDWMMYVFNASRVFCHLNKRGKFLKKLGGGRGGRAVQQDNLILLTELSWPWLGVSRVDVSRISPLLKVSCRNSLQEAIYIVNSIDKTKLSSSVFARPTGMSQPFIQVTCSKERKWHGVYDQSDHLALKSWFHNAKKHNFWLIVT